MKDILGGLVTIIVAVVASVLVIAMLDQSRHATLVEALTGVEKQYTQIIEDNAVLSRQTILLTNEIDRLTAQNLELKAEVATIQAELVREKPVDLETEEAVEPEESRMEKQSADPIFQFLEDGGKADN